MSNTFNNTVRVPVTLEDGSPLVVDTSIYAANDVVGGLCKVAYEGLHGATLRGITVRDTDQEDAELLLYFYANKPPSDIADNATFAPTVADGDLEVGQATVAAGLYKAAPGGAYDIAHVPNSLVDINVPQQSAGELYLYITCTGTPTYTAVDDLEIFLTFWVD